MCIRDRVQTGRYTGTLGEGWDPGMYALEVRTGDERTVLRAVSYTHLRAHETVLDLVCRLLLEKKKQLIPNFVLPPKQSNVVHLPHTQHPHRIPTHTAHQQLVTLE